MALFTLARSRARAVRCLLAPQAVEAVAREAGLHALAQLEVRLSAHFGVTPTAAAVWPLY
jgi:hypothetical protein